MATFYLDFENGNDANDGTTFANRWKTIGSGATAARIAPGDTIRIMASADPVSPGNATWTDNSGTVTWAAAKNAIIDNCDTAWTAAANVTATATTNRKEGSNAANIAPATAFTTGKMAYITLGAPLDLSTFEQVSLWLYSASTSHAAGVLQLKLCSDTTGDTAVETFNLPAMTAAQWRAVVLNKGAALSSGINSVALYAASDPGTSVIRLDNIVACKAAASADCVTHAHCVGKNTGGEPEWYPIYSIGASAVILGGNRVCQVGNANDDAMPYRGTTETVATYTLLGVDTQLQSATDRTTQDNGSEGSVIHYSGGWNRTDMSTQTGATYLNGFWYSNQGLISANRWQRFSKLGFLNFAGVTTNVSAGSNLIELEQAVGCTALSAGTLSADGDTFFSFTQAQGMNGNFSATPGTNRGRYVFRGTRIHGSTGGATQSVIDLSDPCWTLDIAKIDNARGYGVRDAAVGVLAKLRGTTFANIGVADVRLANRQSRIFLEDTSANLTISNASAWSGLVHTTREGSATAHRTVSQYWSASSETSVRHTASGIAWKIQPTSTTAVTSYNRAEIPVAKIACNASALVTVKMWVRRSNTGIAAGIRVYGNTLPGIGNADIDTAMTAAADTWEELTLTFTPTVAGVVEIMGYAYGGTTYTAYFDDLTVTQA